MVELSVGALKKKRERIQNHFWSQVGAEEHISLPMLEDLSEKNTPAKMIDLFKRRSN